MYISLGWVGSIFHTLKIGIHVYMGEKNVLFVCCDVRKATCTVDNLAIHDDVIRGRERVPCLIYGEISSSRFVLGSEAVKY